MKVKLLFLAVLVLGCFALLRYFPATESPSSIAPKTIVLISIDTLRSDHMSCYGYEKNTTPEIDEFSQNAVLFEHCFSNIPLTCPSHSTMLTGLLPPTHGVQDNLTAVLPDSMLTLPEMLKQRGYSTYGIISAEVMNRKYGLDQGFDVYDDVFQAKAGKERIVAQRYADETLAQSLVWLEENHHKKTFMFLHFYDPHQSYAPPAPFDEAFSFPYDGEIAFVDDCVGALFDQLKKLGLYDDALIIVTADHGELIDEHGVTGHGYFIYHNALRVPLIIKQPHHEGVVRITDNTSLVDIAPTIMAQCGIEIPVNVQGTNLSPYLRGEDGMEPERALFNECLTATKYGGNGLLGVIQDKWHYIQSTRPELYNWADDPGELNDLYSQEPQRRQRLQKVLSDLVESATSADQELSISLDAASRDRLQGLGYVAGDVDTSLAFDRDKADAKDLFKMQSAMQVVAVLSHDKKFDQAIEICRHHAREYPDIQLFQDKLASLYVSTKNFEEAIVIAKAALAKDPENRVAMKAMARSCYFLKRYEQSIEILINSISEVSLDSVDSYSLLGDNYRALKQSTKALDSYKKAIALDENYLSAHVGAAEVCNALGKIKEMIAYSAKVVLLDDTNANSHNILAWVQASSRDASLYDPVSALRHARMAAKLAADKDSVTHRFYPHYLDTLSVAQAANGDFAEAVKTANQAILLLTESNDHQVAADVAKRLALFNQGKAFRE